jgi:hypothetical protein
MHKERLGYIFVLLGAGLHPVAWFPILIYIISRFIKFRLIYLYISIVIGIILKRFVYVFNQFINIPFVGSKISTYIYGEWAQYRFHDNSEYIKIFILLLIIMFVFYVITFRFIDLKVKIDKFFVKYNNFILWYFAISLWFVNFRTIELRLLFDGIIFFFPLFYQIFLNRKIYKKRLLSFFLLLVWFAMIDIRTFNIWNNSYIIGSGLPFNFLESPIIIILKGAI